MVANLTNKLFSKIYKVALEGLALEGVAKLKPDITLAPLTVPYYIYLHPLKIVTRHRDNQLYLGENDLYLLYCRLYM